MPIRLVTPHPNPLPQGERELLPWCNALCLLHPSPLPQGERGWLPWCNALRLLHPTPLPLGGGDCYRGRLRFANRPYSTLLVPGPSETPSRVEPSHLAAGAGCRAGIRQRRYRPWLSLPQCAADPGIRKRVQRAPTPILRSRRGPIHGYC